MIQERLPRIGVALALVAVGLFAAAYLRLPRTGGAERTESTAMNLPKAGVPADADWHIFSAIRPRGQAPRGKLSERFRLAGTYFIFSGQDEPSERARKAIIDDVREHTQHLVSEGSSIDEILVERIFPERVVLTANGRTEELWLSFSGNVTGSEHGEPRPSAAPPASMLEHTTFGNRVGTNRWVFQREKIMDYYQELLDDPERLAAVFASLKPDRSEEGSIEGYFLDVEGEGDFFKAVGLHPGDVIRKVNSMRMTSRYRAEYMIKEFVQNRMSAVVLDVEHKGKNEKLIYMIR